MVKAIGLVFKKLPKIIKKSKPDLIDFSKTPSTKIRRVGAIRILYFFLEFGDDSILHLIHQLLDHYSCMHFKYLHTTFSLILYLKMQYLKELV